MRPHNKNNNREGEKGGELDRGGQRKGGEEKCKSVTILLLQLAPSGDLNRHQFKMLFCSSASSHSKPNWWVFKKNFYTNPRGLVNALK